MFLAHSTWTPDTDYSRRLLESSGGLGSLEQAAAASAIAHQHHNSPTPGAGQPSASASGWDHRQFPGDTGGRPPPPPQGFGEVHQRHASGMDDEDGRVDHMEVDDGDGRYDGYNAYR
ncbi:hypothetical protein HK104_007905 [Borealophlyctis nickersoniae]|nr:hypothetical protein HK104_007905 [Borealophlyctis nickersoniae]